MKSYRELHVWQLSMDLVLEVYKLTKHFPKEEMYGLTSQIRRAAVSVPANIAEGWGREHTREYIHHLLYAKGSVCEIETELEVAYRLDFFSEVEYKSFEEMCKRIGQMLVGLIRSLRSKQNKSGSPLPVTGSQSEDVDFLLR